MALPPQWRHAGPKENILQTPSTVPLDVWDGALKNYAPNFDDGGRLMAAWLDR